MTLEITEVKDYLATEGLINFVGSYERLVTKLVEDFQADVAVGLATLPLCTIPGRAWHLLMQEMVDGG